MSIKKIWLVVVGNSSVGCRFPYFTLSTHPKAVVDWSVDESNHCFIIIVLEINLLLIIFWIHLTNSKSSLMAPSTPLPWLPKTTKTHSFFFFPSLCTHCILVCFYRIIHQYSNTKELDIPSHFLCNFLWNFESTIYQESLSLCTVCLSIRFIWFLRGYLQ